MEYRYARGFVNSNGFQIRSFDKNLDILGPKVPKIVLDDANAMIDPYKLQNCTFEC